MRIINLKDLSRKDYQRIVDRSAGVNQLIMSSVQTTMEKVRKQGDRTIFQKYQQRFGKEKYRSIQVTPAEIKKAYLEVDKKTIKAFNTSTTTKTATIIIPIVTCSTGKGNN